MEKTNKIKNPKISEEFKSHTPESIGTYEGPKRSLNQYHIYHSMNKKYMFTEHEHQPRKYAGYVMAGDMEEAVELSQNSAKEWNPVNPQRSTSTGDIVQDDYGFYMVCTKGFRLLCLVEDERGE